MSTLPPMDKQIIIRRPTAEVLEAFLKTVHTAQWWQGCQTHVDEAAGMLSWYWRNHEGSFAYITHARIQQYQPGLFLELNDIWQYSKTDAAPIGPLRLLLECTPHSDATMLVLRSSGFISGDARWKQYYDDVNKGWDEVLPRLKQYLEQRNLT